LPRYAAELCGENAPLRDTIERQRMLQEDKDAKIAELEERVARLGVRDLPRAGREEQAAARPHPSGMPAPPRSRYAAVPH